MPKYLTFDEVLERLPYKPSYLYKLMHEGRIPYYKPTGKIALFLESDIEKFLARGRKSANYEVSEAANKVLNGRKASGRAASGAMTA